MLNMENETKVLKKKNGVALKKPKIPMEDIIFNCFTHCEADDELSTIQKELIKNAMVEYAQLKCKEQRDICWRTYIRGKKQSQFKYEDCFIIKNSPEPKHKF